MPIYEYRCDKCGVFEYSQRITEPALSSCPQCGGAVSRLISRTSFVLKGTGWYITDYARNGKKFDEAQETKSESADKGTKESSASSADSGGSSTSKSQEKVSSGASASV